MSEPVSDGDEEGGEGISASVLGFDMSLDSSSRSIDLFFACSSALVSFVPGTSSGMKPPASSAGPSSGAVPPSDLTAFPDGPASSEPSRTKPPPSSSSSEE